MTVKIYAIVDAKMGTFMQPFFALTNGQAARSFGDTALDPNSGVHKHPEDYVLYYIGEFDDNSGELHPLVKPEYINKALDFFNADEIPVRRVK